MRRCGTFSRNVSDSPPDLFSFYLNSSFFAMFSAFSWATLSILSGREGLVAGGKMDFLVLFPPFPRSLCMLERVKI